MAGHVIFKSLPLLGDYEVYGIARNVTASSNIFNLDVANIEELSKIIDLKFDVIINCIGILNKDAEDNPHKAIWFNSYFPHFLEAITKNTLTKVISISTDCVFSGKKGGYIENDFKDGEGFYAQSKALGEILNNKDLTIRTSIIGPELNEDGIGLFHWFMQQKGTINGFTNAIWAGVTTLELAKAISWAIENNISGLYHITNNKSINKNDLLNLFKKYTNKNLLIIATEGKKVNKSFIDTRQEINFRIPDYDSMVKEMIELIKNNGKLYSHYKLNNGY
ncbi:MAG: NAD(P)-dependent oxidoreductase [Lutibacter sp. BRH_c52]|nr:MAG: NAD(P)-dependent oxidoreductase [Lutibacter sp. BRH_c52]